MGKKNFLTKFKGLFSKKQDLDDEFEFVDENGNVIDPEDYDDDYEDHHEDTGEFERREMTFTDINADDLRELGSEAPPPIEELIDDDTDQFDVGATPNQGDFIEKTHPSIPLDQLEEQLAQMNLEDFEDEDDSHDLDTSQFVVMSKSKKGQAKNKLLGVKNKLFSKMQFGSFFSKKKSSSLSQGKKNSNAGTFNWDDFIALIFAPEHRPRYHKYFIIALCIASSYSIGKLVAEILAGQNQTMAMRRARAQTPISFARPSNLRADTQTIASTNLFNALENDNPVKDEPVKKKPQGPAICEEASKKSALPLTLLNTLVLQDSVKSIASVQMRSSREPIVVREGEKIESLAEVGKIDSLKLVFKNLQSGECEYIASAEEKPPKTAGKISVLSPGAGKAAIKEAKDSGIINEGNKYKIKKTLRDDMLNNISEVLTQARAVKIQNPDGSLAFKMTEIVPGSVYSKLNIQNDDIITHINGKKITNLNEIMSLFGRIKEVDQLSLTISRGGMPQDFDYNFE